MKIFSMVSTAKSLPYTLKALETFEKTTILRKSDIFFLIDNDASFSYEIPTWVNLIKNSTPKSFAANANFALSHALPERADVILLNNDLLFTESWLEELLSPERAILSPISNREAVYRSNDFEWKNVLTLDEIRGREEELTAIVKTHRTKNFGSQTVLALPFFCVFIPFLVYSEIGLFDESYGVGGGEDYDYCIRAALKKIPVRYRAGSYVLHFNGKSTWHGAESGSDTCARVKEFSTHFEVRWGKALKRLLIDEDKTVLTEHPHALNAIQNGKVNELIEILRGVG